MEVRHEMSSRGIALVERRTEAFKSSSNSEKYESVQTYSHRRRWHPPRSSGASVQQIGGGLRVLKLMQYQGSQPLWSSDMLEVMFGMATHAGGHVWHGNT